MVWIKSADYFKSLFIPILSAMDSHGLWRNRFVCHGQLWLVKQNGFLYLGQLWSEENRILSVVEIYRW